MKVVCGLLGPGFRPGVKNLRISCSLVLSEILGFFIASQSLIMTSLLRLLNNRGFSSENIDF